MNIFVINCTGTTGFPIGLQSDGTLEWLELDSTPLGTSSVQITGPTRKNVDTVKVHATCSMEVMAA